MKTCPLEEKRDPPCARQVAPFPGDPRKGARPALHWQRSRKSSKYSHKSYRKAGRTFPRQPPKGARPALHWPITSKSSKYNYKSKRKAGRTHFGSWSYLESILYLISLSHLAKSETLPKPESDCRHVEGPA